MFDMETPAHLHFEDSSSTGSSKHSQHKATTAAGHQSPVSLLTGMAARKEGLFMGQGSAQNMPPQRVMPAGDQPAISDATQQQLFSQLQAVLQGEGAGSIVKGGAPAPTATVVSVWCVVGDASSLASGKLYQDANTASVRVMQVVASVLESSWRGCCAHIAFSQAHCKQSLVL